MHLMPGTSVREAERGMTWCPTTPRRRSMPRRRGRVASPGPPRDSSSYNALNNQFAMEYKVKIRSEERSIFICRRVYFFMLSLLMKNSWYTHQIISKWHWRCWRKNVLLFLGRWSLHELLNLETLNDLYSEDAVRCMNGILKIEPFVLVKEIFGSIFVDFGKC